MPKRVIAALAIIAAISVTAMLTGDADEERSDASRGPRTRPAWRGRGPALSEQQQQEVLEMLKEHQLGHYQRLMELREQDPDRYQAALHSAWRWYLRYKSMPEEVRQAANDSRNAKIAIYRVTRELQNTHDTYMRTRLVKELRQALRQEFQADLVVREYRLNQIEAELERLREEFQQRRENAEEIISERLEQHVDEHLKATTQPTIIGEIDDADKCCPSTTTAPAE